ncbi:LPXTG cell wall anchor domain-containing protein [Streptococcus sp. X16XC17]|uniref:LPXTG cell wall anchor domain-containing protein n=1 Tax=unclassified Streptococcus TaxID=2608887 RepID=UPI00069D0809|nr:MULTISPECIES: LPXTG cell wall anchor domain-containing protein [unclassified Streptococcus]TCD46308.1 LPXTG cell wall anchor domain-containing protein [Streptococcus sp. X16XC17]
MLVSDTTSGNQPIETVTTNDKGQAVFSALPTNHSISVTVNGIVQGYTLRTSEAGSQLFASFTAKGQGVGNPTYSKQAAIITVRNEDGEPLKDQTVTLKTQNGRVIETITTGVDGVAKFTKELMDGTFYTYEVNNKALGQIMPGDDISAYLKADQILAKSEDKDSKSDIDSADKVEASEEKASANAASATATKVTPKDGKKALPSTGETTSVVWNLLGITLASVVGFMLSLRAKGMLKK